MKTKNLAELYDLAPLDWDAASASLPEGQAEDADGGPGRYTAWLTTINADGSPHITGVGARWDDGAYWIVSGRTARKGRNLERDPRCAVSLSTKGYDVVVEGTAELVTDPDEVSAVGRAVRRRGLAVRGRRIRYGTHGPVQRAVGGSAAVAPVPRDPHQGHRIAGPGSGRRDVLVVRRVRGEDLVRGGAGAEGVEPPTSAL